MKQHAEAFGGKPEAAEYAGSRIGELETENARLRLLVSELLVKNQSLRESADNTFALPGRGSHSLP